MLILLLSTNVESACSVVVLSFALFVHVVIPVIS